MDWTGQDRSAPTTHLEVVTVYRPTRVTAAVCCFLCAIAMIISICPTAWAETGTDIIVREGLFQMCTKGADACVSQDKEFTKAVAALIIIGFILMGAAGVLIAFGMNTQQDDIKYILYNVALAFIVVCGLLILIALIVFPVMLDQALASSPDEAWMIEWAYMLDWAAFVISVVAFCLLVCDRNPDETSVREKIVN